VIDAVTAQVCKSKVVRKAGILLLSFCYLSTADAQGGRTAMRKLPPPNKPACSKGAICFSGEVFAGEEFRKELNSQLDFVLKPAWTIAIEPKRREANCGDGDFASVENPPYRAHRAVYIDASYGWTAEQEVSVSPREFDFVTNCVDYRAESDRLSIVLWPYTAKSDKEYDEAMAKLGSVPLGKGRLWITGSKISHANDTPDQNEGKIERLQFSVEIVLPSGTPKGQPH
jgi:hypothetical protein